MPHVIIEGPASVEKFYQQFETIYVREQETILKVKDVFLNTKRMKALLECIVVENRFSKNFYIAISQGEQTITVRLDSLTDPEKTDGVKRLLALVGHQLKSQASSCHYGRHNLEGYLAE